MGIEEDIARQIGNLASPSQRTAIALSDQAGIPPENINREQGAPFGLRVSMSFAQNDDDIRTKFFKRYPNGGIARVSLDTDISEDPAEPQGVIGRAMRISEPLVFRTNIEDTNEKWKFIDPPLGTMNLGEVGSDIAEIPGQALPIIGAILTSTSKPGILRQAGRLALGIFGGEIIQRDINALTGSDISAMDNLQDAGIDAGLAGVLGIGVGGVFKVLNAATGRGAANATEAELQDIAAVRSGQRAFEEAGEDMGTLVSFQQLPANPVTRRTGSQAVMASQESQGKILAQPGQLVGAAEATARAEGRTLEQTTRELQVRARTTYRRTSREVRNRYRVAAGGNRRGDQALQDSVDSVITGTRNQVNQLYGVADRAAAAEAPIFSIAGAKEEIRNIVAPTRGRSASFDDDVDALIRSLGGESGNPNVIPISEPLKAEFSSILKTLDKLDDTQTDYNVLKELRTRLFSLRDALPYERNNATRLANETYYALSRALNNPVSEAPAYREAIAQASTTAAARFRTLENEQLRAIVTRSSNTGELVERFGDPNRIDAHLMGLIDQHASRQAAPFKQAVISRQVMSDSGNVVRMENLRNTDPELFGWLTKGSGVNADLWARGAQLMDDLNASNIAQAAQSQTRGLGVVEGLLARKGTSPSEINTIVEQFGGTGSTGHQSLINGAWELMVNRSVQVDQVGLISFNPQAAGTLIREFRESGVWRILGSNDRLKMNALQRFASLRARTVSDVGATLEMASAISQLKNPSTFVSGAREIGVNKLFAFILSSDAANSVLLGSGKRQLTGGATARMVLALEALHETTQPGDQSLLDAVAGGN